MTRTMVEPPARDPVHSEPPAEASSSDRRTRMRSGAALVAGALLAIAAVTAFILHKLAAQDPDTWLIDLRVYLLGLGTRSRPTSTTSSTPSRRCRSRTRPSARW